MYTANNVRIKQAIVYQAFRGYLKTAAISFAIGHTDHKTFLSPVEVASTYRAKKFPVPKNIF
jgi:hypothetical protein